VLNHAAKRSKYTMGIQFKNLSQRADSRFAYWGRRDYGTRGAPPTTPQSLGAVETPFDHGNWVPGEADD